MVRVGSEVKFKTEAGYDERPFLITRMETYTDSVMIVFVQLVES